MTPCGPTCSSTTRHPACTRRPTTHERRCGPRTPWCSPARWSPCGPGDDVVTDVEKFEGAAGAALAAADRGLAEEAIASYRGDLLPHDRYEPWCETPRERLSALHRELLRLAGRWEQLVAVDPADEDAHVALIRRSLEEGDRPGALRQYERLERALAAELGLKPGRAAQGLRTELLATAPDGRATELEVLEPIGRERELSTVDSLLERMSGTGGRVLFIAGPPGSGKTALVTTLLARARRRHVRAGLGVAATVEAPWPYAPVLEALADLCRRHPALLDGLQDSFREEIELALSGRDLLWSGAGGHQRLFVAVVELMRLAAAGHGALLVVDDAHSADPESLRLLHYLSRATANDAVLLVMAHRPRPAPAELVALRRAAAARGSGVVLALEPLSPDDTAAVVRRVVPDATRALSSTSGTSHAARLSPRPSWRTPPVPRAARCRCPGCGCTRSPAPCSRHCVPRLCSERPSTPTSSSR